MVEYKCIRCGYSTTYLNKFKNHVERKNRCLPMLQDISYEDLKTSLIEQCNRLKEYKCDLCGKCFNKPQGKYQHKQYCKGTPNMFLSFEKQIQELKHELSKVKSENLALKSTINNIEKKSVNNTITNNTVNNITINVKLNNFGSENMAAIPHSLIRSCFINLEYRCLFENLYLDPEYPENHNIRLISYKKQQLEIYKNDTWKLISVCEGLREVISRLSNIFETFNRKHNDEVLKDMDEQELDILLRDLDEISRFSNKSKTIKKDLLCALDEHKKKMSL